MRWLYVHWSNQIIRPLHKAMDEWKTPATCLRLAPNEVHIWRVCLEVPERIFHLLSRLLSAEEQERSAKFHLPNLRRRFIASHGALRTVISAYLHLPPECLAYTYEPHGKPKLKDESQARFLSFNLAHSHELALIAIAQNPWVGIDVEFRQEIDDAEAIARRFFSPEEYRIFSQLPPEEKQDAFYRCWTRKEAFIKALGEGLSCPLNQFSVSYAPGESARFLEITGDPEAVSAWSLFGFEPWESYTAALAIRAIGAQAVFWHWSEHLI